MGTDKGNGTGWAYKFACPQKIGKTLSIKDRGTMYPAEWGLGIAPKRHER